VVSSVDIKMHSPLVYVWFCRRLCAIAIVG
jgi:hypothetical protein